MQSLKFLLKFFKYINIYDIPIFFFVFYDYHKNCEHQKPDAYTTISHKCFYTTGKYKNPYNIQVHNKNNNFLFSIKVKAVITRFSSIIRQQIMHFLFLNLSNFMKPKSAHKNIKHFMMKFEEIYIILFLFE